MPKTRKRDMYYGRPLSDISIHSGSSHYSFLVLLLTCLFSQISSTSPVPAPRISYHDGPSSTKLYDLHRTFNVRVIAAVCAAVSMMASFIVFYWFCRMEKRFRHILIMILIYGDLMKASWLFIFATVSMARGTVKTYSSFCQASGFLVQYGMETSDFAVLVIAIHSAVQVFRPSALPKSDGLYPFRHSIYIAAFLIPVLMAGLAFVNPHWGYMSQGAFCSLPLRPFWYRLALAWIPRYMIAIIILGLAAAIYTHVGFEFRAFSQVGQSIEPSISCVTPMLSTCDMEEGNAVGLETADRQRGTSIDRRASSIVPEPVTVRRASAVAFAISMVDPHDTSQEGRSQSVPVGLRKRHPDNIHLSTTQALDTTARSTSNTKVPSEATSRSNSRNPSPLGVCPTSHVQRQLTQERARIHRQLRLMFIYPLTFILMWIVPFASHCMMYRDKFAAHPVYWLSMLSTICVTLMGAVDCLIFSLREQPWKHMCSSDGSFWGSFAIWRRSPEACARGREESEAAVELGRSFFNTNWQANSSGLRRVSVDGEKGRKRDLSVRLSRTQSFIGSMNSLATRRSTNVMSGDRGVARMRLELEKEERRREQRDRRVV